MQWIRTDRYWKLGVPRVLFFIFFVFFWEYSWLKRRSCKNQFSEHPTSRLPPSNSTNPINTNRKLRNRTRIWRVLWKKLSGMKMNKRRRRRMKMKRRKSRFFQKWKNTNTYEILEKVDLELWQHTNAKKVDCLYLSRWVLHFQTRVYYMLTLSDLGQIEENGWAIYCEPRSS